MRNGSFECDTRSVWARCYAANCPDVSVERVEEILDSLQRVKILFRWQDTDGRTWGFWVGIRKPGRLPGPSRKDHEKSGAEPPVGQLVEFIGTTGQPSVNQPDASGCVGLGSGLGSGLGLGQGDGDGLVEHGCKGARGAEPPPGSVQGQMEAHGEDWSPEAGEGTTHLTCPSGLNQPDPVRVDDPEQQEQRVANPENSFTLQPLSEAKEFAEFFWELEGQSPVHFEDSPKYATYLKHSAMALDIVPDLADLKNRATWGMTNDKFLREREDLPIALFKTPTKLEDLRWEINRDAKNRRGSSGHANEDDARSGRKDKVVNYSKI
jgi:hypothetical protein